MTSAATDGGDSAKRVVIIDTNVLLADPNSILSFPRAEVVIPETVLGELDKLKTARVDPDLRFRGREVSRMLFEFSEEGSLVDGVDLPDGGRLRVAPFDSDADLPEGLVARNADDRILATAYQVCQTRRSRLRSAARHQRPQHAAQGPDPRRAGCPLRRGGRGRLRTPVHHPPGAALQDPAHHPRGGARGVRGGARRRQLRRPLGRHARRCLPSFSSCFLNSSSARCKRFSPSRTTRATPTRSCRWATSTLTR